MRRPLPLPWRRRQPLRELGEAEAYARAYGHATGEVRTVELPVRRPRFPVLLSGEEVRRRFEQRLAERDERREQGR